MEDFEDWEIDNEGDLMEQFIKETGLEHKFNLWKTLEYVGRQPEERE